MPGFNSHLFGHGHFSSLRASTPSPPLGPPSPSPIPPPSQRVKRQRARHRRFTVIYGTRMTRKELQHLSTSLHMLKREVEAQVERFHDMGVTSPSVRKPAVETFKEKNSHVLLHGAGILQCFGGAEGPVETLSRELMQLAQASAGSLAGWEDMRAIVIMYQTVLEVLRSVIEDVAGRLSSMEEWTAG